MENGQLATNVCKALTSLKVDIIRVSNFRKIAATIGTLPSPAATRRTLCSRVAKNHQIGLLSMMGASRPMLSIITLRSFCPACQMSMAPMSLLTKMQVMFFKSY